MKSSDLFNRKDHMVLDDISTWPDDLLISLKRDQRILRDYKQEQQRLDDLAIHDYSKRWNPDPNEFEDEYVSALQNTTHLLHGKTAVGFHCSRLADDEIEDIKINGLSQLSGDLVQARIAKRVANGDMTSETAELLVTKSLHSKQERVGQVCLIASMSTLRWESGVRLLFKYWGGEALYGHHQFTPEAVTLKSLGQPCIVVGEVEVGEIAGSLEDAAHLFTESFCQQVSTGETNVEADLFLKRTVKVLDVITYSEERFETLTGASQWDESIA